MAKINRIEAEELAESFCRSIAPSSSKKTVASYREGVRQFINYCGESVELLPDKVNRFVMFLLDERKVAPATARLRQLAVRRFSAWLASEGEIPRDELLGLKAPKIPDTLILELDEEQITALLRTCDTKTFAGKRDDAIIRFMVETGARCDEVISMTVNDIDRDRGLAYIRKAKGGKVRIVTFGSRTLAAIDRYMRARRKHRLADTAALWLGDRSQGFSYNGLYRSLKLKGKAAGIRGFHPHVLRHTFARRWLDKGGSEGGLMAQAGWSKRDMIDRYTRMTSERRAIDEARRLRLGDL